MNLIPLKQRFVFTPGWRRIIECLRAACQQTLPHCHAASARSPTQLFSCRCFTVIWIFFKTLFFFLSPFLSLFRPLIFLVVCSLLSVSSFDIHCEHSAPTFQSVLYFFFFLPSLSATPSIWYSHDHVFPNSFHTFIFSLILPTCPVLSCVPRVPSNSDVFLVSSVSLSLNASMCLLSFGDASLSTASTLEHIPSSAVARPRPLVRQQSLQQPLTHQPPPGPNDPPVTSQSLGQLHTGPGGGGHRGGPRGVRGSPAGASRYRGGGAGRSRSNPGSWDHMVEQIRHRGLDVKSFLWVFYSVTSDCWIWTCWMNVSLISGTACMTS